MHNYKIYGLQISSTRTIELLSESEPTLDEPDLTVDWIVSEAPENGLEWTQVHSELLKLYTVITLWKNEDETLTKVCFELKDRDPLNFVVDSKNKKLTIFHHPDELKSDLESYLVGPALGIVMRLRGIVCLHSSVVGIDGRAIALIGHSTAGKSTLAAGLGDAGARILADDIAVLTSEGERFVVHPGYSKVRLRPVAARFLNDDPESLPIVYSHRDSRYVSLDDTRGHRGEPLPLSAVYVLGGHSKEYKEPFVEDLHSKDKLLSLLQNTYGSYVVMDTLRAREFEVLSRIAQSIPIRKLYYAHDITTLPKQCEIILKDFMAKAATK